MEVVFRRSSQEIFGLARIITSLPVVVATEAVNFVAEHVIRPLILGALKTVSNLMLKPLLAGTFSLILQPIFVFTWNTVNGLRQILSPVVDVLGSVMSKCGALLQSFRLVEVNLGTQKHSSRRCAVCSLSGGRERQDV